MNPVYPDTTSRTLYLYLGGFSSGGTLTAHLSNTSFASDFVTSFSSSGKYNDVVEITYNAASAGQTLTLSYVKSLNTDGSVDLMGAWM